MCAINIRTFERNDFNAVELIMLILYLPHSHYEMMLFIHLYLIKAQVSHEKRFGCQRCRNFNTLRALLWNLYICLFLSLILALKFNIQSKIFDLFRQFSIVLFIFSPQHCHWLSRSVGHLPKLTSGTGLHWEFIIELKDSVLEWQASKKYKIPS